MYEFDEELERLMQEAQSGSTQGLYLYTLPPAELAARLDDPRSGWGHHSYKAKVLSALLRGVDRDVKEYFFQLSPEELSPILDGYERAYGKPARQYAQRTIPLWKSRRVPMSGMVAGRLFSLVPSYMPLETKYHLAKKLWVRLGPSSRMRVRVGRNASLNEVLEAVRIHMSEVVRQYHLPVALERRFKWLNDPDVQLEQRLLNQLLAEEPALVLAGIRAEFPVLQRHMSSARGGHTHRLAHTVRVGNHNIELVFGHSFEGIRLEDPTQKTSLQWSTWCWTAMCVGVLAVLIGVLWSVAS